MSLKHSGKTYGFYSVSSSCSSISTFSFCPNFSINTGRIFFTFWDKHVVDMDL